MSDNKLCTQCKTTKSKDEFYKQIQRSLKTQKAWEYHDSMCKVCRSNYSSERRRKIKLQAIEYLGGRCKNCGIVDNPSIFDFHHRDPLKKDFGIGKQAKSFLSIKVELDKCDLLCANCHRKQHDYLSI